MKKRRITSIVLAAALALTMNAGTVWGASGELSDIKGHWAENIIKEASGLGIVSGYPEGYFLPENLMKREEFFKLLTNVLTVKPDTTKTVLSFKDVDPIEWYVPTIKTIAEAGIANGYDDGTIGIGMIVSRQEAAKLVAAIIPDGNMNSSAATAATVKDRAEIGDWAYASVDKMFKKGYMKGDTEGKFRPTAALTRAEAATLLLSVKKNESVISGPKQTGQTVIPQPGDIANPGGKDITGSGTKRDPYVIYTAEGLNQMRNTITEAAFYMLNNDIAVKKDYETAAEYDSVTKANWSAGNFAPIGAERYPFEGTFDGNGKTISGLDIRGEVRNSGKTDTAGYAGLFGYIGEGGVVEGVTLADSKISGKSFVGGIAGQSDGMISDCVIDTNTAVKGDVYVGGIVGNSEGLLESNLNKGKVAGGTHTGGIAGSIDSVDAAMADCVNRGDVEGGDNTGGVVGSVYGTEGNVTVSKCSNSGTVDAGTTVAGGVVGLTSRDRSVTVEHCSNSGDVSGGMAGGIVGTNESEIIYGYNEGTVTGKNGAGGIAAVQTGKYAKISASQNEGNITSKTNAGGIIANNEGKVNSCYNTGKISGDTATGGIVGKNNGVVWKVYNAGRLSGDSGEGSLVGRNAGELSESFWLEGTCESDTGLRDSGASRSMIALVTDEELKGDSKVKVGDKSGYVVKLLNTDLTEAIWEQGSGSYKYPRIINLNK